MAEGRRTALVTGAGRGIGRAIATAFKNRGWTVFEADLTPAAGARSLVLDVREPASWQAATDRIADQVGHLDVLVNNAGILREGSLEDTTLEVWNEVLAVNLTGTFLGARAMVGLLERGTTATILNVASVAALRGSRWHSAYAASKGGVAALTRALAIELADRAITVNAMCPGSVDTEMLHGLLREQVGVDSADLHPLRRISTPEDQANAAVFLCSPAASYITGVSLSVDGGRAIR